MVVSHLAIKSFDLVIALTAGGPGYSTDLPATFMYAMSFSRGQIGLGAASADDHAGHGRRHRRALSVFRTEDQEVNRPPSSLTWHRIVLWTALVLFAACAS